MKKWIAMIALIAMIGFAGTANAAKGSKGDKKGGAGVMGKISAVDASAKTITIESKKDGAKTVTLADGASIKLDGADATIDKLNGMYAKVTVDGDGKATAITASATMPEKKPKK